MRRALLLFALPALAAVACADGANGARPRHVLFVLVDTLRADHLSAYGYRRPTSPTLEAFAGGALLFENARSQAACTFPSVNSILTSRWPAAFLGQPEKAMGIPEGIPSLAEVLRDRGFATAAVSASPIVRASPSRHNPGGGFDRGFERFDESCLWREAACVNAVAFGELDRLAAEDRPFFLYLHYMDPHGPYAPPAGWQRRFAGPGPAAPEKEFIRRGDPNPIAAHLYRGAPDPGATAADVAHLVDLYDEEIASFDAELGRLLGALDARGLAGETIVVLASDHGEEFLEHGHVKHCHTLFDTEIKTPLVLRIPGVPGGRRLPQRAQNLDIVPTLLDYLDIEVEGVQLDGRSLEPTIEDGLEVGDLQLALQGPLRSAADGRFKLVHDLGRRGADGLALYDLEADPGETRDVATAERRTFGRLRRLLAAWLAAVEPRGEGDAVRRAEEAERRLRSLGYLE